MAKLTTDSRREQSAPSRKHLHLVISAELHAALKDRYEVISLAVEQAMRKEVGMEPSTTLPQAF